MSNAVYIPSLDAKDLYLSSQTGYSLFLRNGNVNYNKYINTIPYSLDLIKLREVYEAAYRNRYFSWMYQGKEYTKHIINVTFKYSVKEFNRVNRNMYVRCGHMCRDDDLTDCALVQDGQLVAIKVGEPVADPLPLSLLGDLFACVDGKYALCKTLPTIKTVAELRHHVYEHGFDVDGIHYVRFKRSAGSARVGKCLFIDSRLYHRMHHWDMTGLPIRKGDYADLAALETYMSLTSSSIIDTMEIEPENILLIDDWNSVFEDEAVATFVGDDGDLQTEHKTVTISNSIWDGQSMLDKTMFGKYAGRGFLLLRNRFFKSAAFNCDIQKFFADYGITSVSQLNGKTRAKEVADIKIITTPSSIKYLKFGSFDQWLDNLDTTFGIVKYEKPTKHLEGRMVQTHYQLINTLQLTLDEVRELLQPSLDYAKLLKTNPAVFRYHIRYPHSLDWRDVAGDDSTMSKNDAVYVMLGMNADFARTKLYADFRDACITSFLRNIRKGKILVNGTYCTLCGNPMEMLLHSIGRFDGASLLGVGNVHNVRFPDGATLLGTRSPHVTMGNVWLMHNSRSADIDRYLKCTDEIIYVNAIKENLMERLSGCDYDADTALITDNPILIKAAQRNYENFAVPTRLVKSTKGKKRYLPHELADLDIKTSVNKIGEIINLSQELNTRLWDMVNHGRSVHDAEVQDLYNDIARLDVLSNLEIDRAKQVLPVDNARELAKLKQKHKVYDEDGRCIKPNFFKTVSVDKGYYNPKKNRYQKHHTSMDYVQTIMNRRGSMPNADTITVPLSEIIECTKSPNSRQKGQAQRVIALTRQSRGRISAIWSEKEHLSNAEKHLLAEREREECIAYISKLPLSDVTLRYLIWMIEQPGYEDVRQMVFFALFCAPNAEVYKIIESNDDAVPILRKNRMGNIVLFGENYLAI